MYDEQDDGGRFYSLQIRLLRQGETSAMLSALLLRRGLLNFLLWSNKKLKWLLFYSQRGSAENSPEQPDLLGVPSIAPKRLGRSAISSS